MNTRLKHLLACAAAALCCAGADVSADRRDVTALGLEELMNVEVTSVTRGHTTVRRAAAAIHVITAEDIRRSTATSIPELLRDVPGLNVARVDANRWSVSARGFSGLFANKLLVMIDGRTVYSPIFSGVFWDAQDTLLEDIDRIEVIRGPGAAVWGANAVNGVINIITKRASESIGGLLNGGGGDEVNGFGGFRYGTRVEHGAARVYAKYRAYDDQVRSDGNGEAYDGLEMRQAGFRSDLAFDPWELTVQGDLYDGDNRIEAAIPILVPPFSEHRRYPTDLAGGNLLSRLGRVFRDGSELTAQLYYDRAERTDVLLESSIDTWDVDLQYRTPIGVRHLVTVAGNYRYISDDLHGRNAVTFSPHAEEFDLAGAFVQDEISLSKELQLIAGVKFEHHEFSGGEWQPNLRTIWTPDPDQAVWAAVSRAVRTPSRVFSDAAIDVSVVPGDPPILSQLGGNSSARSEKLWSYELGYRVALRSELNLDLALFYNDYDDLTSLEQRQPVPGIRDGVPFLLSELRFQNGGNQHSYGGELLATWHASPATRIQAWYAYLGIDSGHDPGSTDAFVRGEERNPSHQAGAKLSLDLPGDFEFDAAGRYVDSIPEFAVSSYIELSLRLGWRIDDSLELSLAAVDVLHDEHEEYQSDFVAIPKTEIERAVYGEFTWRF